MNDRLNDQIEARLRAALASRAESVEPADDGAEVVDRMAAAGAAASRRRTVLAAAAAVAVVGLLAGAFVLLGEDDPATDLATGDATSPTTGASTTAFVGEISTSTAPPIWPLPTTSVHYAEAADAVAAFGTAYLGFDPSVCVRDPDPDDGTLLLIPTPEGCSVDGEPDPRSAFTVVTVERRAQGWVVMGAESSWLQVTPAAGTVVGADIAVTVAGAPTEATLTAKVPPLGQDPAASPSVDSTTIPRDADGTWRLVLGAADGQTVLLVSDGATATARIFTVDASSVPVETTATTTGPTDDGVQGWPGTTSRQFDGPEAAAQAFVDDVLGFPDPALAGQVIEGADAEFRYTPRPTASIETTLTVHDTGTARGWVVTGVRSTSGTIDSVSRDGDDVSVAGSASAFETTVDVRLIDLAGNVLGETTAMGGGSGVLEPYAAVVHQDVPSSGPVYVQIAEGDASGDGRYVWAAWAPVPS